MVMAIKQMSRALPQGVCNPLIGWLKKDEKRQLKINRLEKISREKLLLIVNGKERDLKEKLKQDMRLNK
jgi:hypothetical protein